MTVDVTVRRPPTITEETLVAELAGLPDVTSAVRTPAREPGDEVTTVQLQMSHDRRPDAVRLLLDRGCGLLELSRARRELESVFLQLSESSTAADVAAPHTSKEASS
jgi:hypothetical protein